MGVNDPQKLFDKPVVHSHLQPFSLLLTLWSVLSTRRWQFVALGVSRELQRQIDSNYYFRSGWSQSLRRWRSWWKARLRQIRSPLTSSRHLPLSFGLASQGCGGRVGLGDSPHHPIFKTLSWSLVWASVLRNVRRKCWLTTAISRQTLVFYHRILKRHVIIELKANRLNYADAAQLHMYLAYYRKGLSCNQMIIPIRYSPLLGM